jgi:membrane-associated protease RseP (regulator of RpoE activity)
MLLALGLFLLTVLSTLAVGAQFALDYASNRTATILDTNPYAEIWNDPSLLLLGIPFSFTLLGILLAHELGHYFACRYYGISASYPYFIPAPTLIGTMGAFIRIRSPIVNRKALFDVGLAGPVVGFLFAVPALALAIAYSKRIPAEQLNSIITFGNPLLAQGLAEVLRPGVPPQDIFLHPVGRAAWVGLFATALNLLPIGQLDGGHIVYAVASEKHRKLSLVFVALLLPLGYLFWYGWLVWAVLLSLLGFRHPTLMDRWEPLDRKRRIWAAVALLIFLLCFMPAPFTVHV